MRLTTTTRLTSGRPRQFSVMWQNIRCSILFHWLVPGGKWHTEMPRPVSSASRCNLHLPQPASAPVRAAAVGCDQQPPRLRIGPAPHVPPPPPERLDGELGRVVTHPDADPPGVRRHVVDAVGDGLALALVDEVVDLHLLGLALGLPLPAAIAVRAHQ